MRPDEIKQKIEELNLSEKLLLIEDVWDEIAKSNQELPMHEWQKRSRFRTYRTGRFWPCEVVESCG